MKTFYLLFFTFSLLFLLPNNSYSQTFDADWSCEYATYDNDVNGTGYNTIATAVVNEDEFVALVRRSSGANYLVGYRDADSANGRLGAYGYGGAMAGFQMTWSNIFDNINMTDAKDLAAYGNLILVANNDPGFNILIFELVADTVVTNPKRLSTGASPIWSVDVDGTGRVFVTQVGDESTPSKILVFNNFPNEPGWTSTNHVGTPMQTIYLPDNGDARGVTVNADGTVIYVSNYLTKNVYCYTGDPVNGYNLYNGFQFMLEDQMIVDPDTLNPAPWGMNFLNGKNILSVACDVDFMLGNGYQYGRIYFLNPNTGAALDTIDTAEWNYMMTGGYQNRPGGTTPGNASGYTSTYNVDWDANENLYTQSYFGWTVDKWNYNGVLPTIELTITNVEKIGSRIPEEFKLGQNYPNPFNPTTTINFAVPIQSSVTLQIFSVTGELIETLIDAAEFDAGSYDITFDAHNLASGTYIYRLQSNDFAVSKKMILIK